MLVARIKHLWLKFVVAVFGLMLSTVVLAEDSITVIQAVPDPDDSDIIAVSLFVQAEHPLVSTVNVKLATTDECSRQGVPGPDHST